VIFLTISATHRITHWKHAFFDLFCYDLRIKKASKLSICRLLTLLANFSAEREGKEPGRFPRLFSMLWARVAGPLHRIFHRMVW
jgi:hypothetical protein